MLVAIAVIGWVLFLFTAFMYWVGMKTNAKDTNALQFFFLATLVSETFYNLIRTDCLKGFDEMAANEFDQRRAIYSSMGSLLLAGQNAMQANLGIVLNETQAYFQDDKLKTHI